MIAPVKPTFETGLGGRNFFDIIVAVNLSAALATIIFLFLTKIETESFYSSDCKFVKRALIALDVMASWSDVWRREKRVTLVE
jgi:hypothetical protein